MTSSWLKEYILEGLGCKIRKTSLRDDETTPALLATEETAADQARLVQILDRGQGDDCIENSTRGPPRNDWWNVNQWEKSPNLSNHTDAWLLVSDGSHSAKVFLSVEALKEIFDYNNKNNNEDNLFGRGCCVLLKKYFIDCHVGRNENDHNSQRNTYSIQLKVLSLEPKPSFNHHNGAIADANHNDKIRPVTEEADVLYGLQFLARQKTPYTSKSPSNTNHKIIRDWEIAFGRLQKGRLNMSTVPYEDAEALMDKDKGLDNILTLAEEAASTDEAIREWEMAKDEYGIDAFDNKTNDSPCKRNQQYGQDCDREDDDDQDREDISRMYIQNVLAVSSEESEDGSEDKKDQTSQNTWGDERKHFLNSGSDGHLQPEIQQPTTLKTQKVVYEDIAQTAVERRTKRPRVNSFESGTASNLTLDDAIIRTSKPRNSTKHMRGPQQKQQALSQHHQESPHNSSGIWESIKEQLFEPGRTILHCVPSYRLPSDGNVEDHILSTPKRFLTSTAASAKNFGSAASTSTNFTSSTPNPSSGAYYRKYGLARWLSQNTIAEERG